MTDIGEHQSAFFHPVVDGRIHLRAYLAVGRTLLLIGAQINLVHHDILAAHRIQPLDQAFGGIHEFLLVVTEESEHVAPRLHGAGVLGNVSFHLVHHLRSLLQGGHRKTSNPDVRFRAVKAAFVLIHIAIVVICDISGLHIQGSHRFVSGYKIHQTVAVLIVVRAVSQKEQILDSAACAAVEVQHPAEVADGRNVFGTAGKLVVNQFRGGNENV